MVLYRAHSRQSMAKGPEIWVDTEGVDEEDKEILVGERKSIYENDELRRNKILNGLVEAEKKHFRLRNLVVVSIPVLSILIVNLLRGSKNLKSITVKAFS